MAAARDARAVFHEAVALAREGKYEDALRNHIWFHDHALEQNPALAGVRLSFALASWVELAGKYPPALRALISTRDEKAGALAAGTGSSESFQDVAAINEQLKEGPRTVALFKAMHRAHPDLARQCYRGAEACLVAHREYALCASYVPDALGRFEAIRQLYRLKTELADENPLLRAGGVGRYAAASFVKESCRLIEILVGAGRGEEAAKVHALAVALSPGAEAREALGRAVGHQEPSP